MRLRPSEAAGIGEARLFVAALADRERQVQLVEHVFRLEQAGAHFIERELLEGSISAGRQALVELGSHPFKAERQSRVFRRHDRDLLDDLREHWTESGMDQGFIGAARARVAHLSEVMESDRMMERHDASERGWTPPPKGDAVA